jgi:hypothetical protein
VIKQLKAIIVVRLLSLYLARRLALGQIVALA